MDDIELPAYESNNDESDYFLNNTATMRLFKKKLLKILGIYLFIIIYIIFFFLITKPFVIDTCRDPIISKNSTCERVYVCDIDNNRCGYTEECNFQMCNNILSWFYCLFLITLIPSLLIWYCLFSIFNFIKKCNIFNE
mgnify:CR=1 FL=1